MKYYPIFIFFLFSNKLLSQSYLLISSGAGITQTSQIGIQDQTQNKSINSFGNSIKILCGYQLKKIPMSVESGIILNSYTIRFKYNPTFVPQFDVNKFATFKTLHFPVSVKWRLNNNNVGKNKKTKKITYYAKTGASVSYYNGSFWKNQLFDYPVGFDENTKYEVRNTVLSRLMPWGTFILVHYGLDFTYQYNNKLKFMFAIENNMGFKSISNATLLNTVIQDDKYRSDSNFVISTSGNLQLLNIGLQYSF
jgi:hypothetical protein